MGLRTVTGSVATEFQPRTNLHRTLVYRKHILHAYYLIEAMAMAMALFALYSFIEGLCADQPVFGLPAAAFYGSVAGLFFLVAERIHKPLAFAKIHVGSDHLEIQRGDHLQLIPYGDVAKVTLNQVPYLGGFFTLKMKSGKAHRFTVVLERSEYILEALASHRPELINAKKLAAYRRTAVIVDHSWSRFYEKLSLRATLLRYAAYPVIACALAEFGVWMYQAATDPQPLMNHSYWKLLSGFVVINAVSRFLVWTFFEMISTFVIARHLHADPNTTVRDKSHDFILDRAMFYCNLATSSALFLSVFSWLVLGLT